MKTERTQIHFLSDILVAVVSLDVKVPNVTIERTLSFFFFSNFVSIIPTRVKSSNVSEISWN